EIRDAALLIRGSLQLYGVGVSVLEGSNLVIEGVRFCFKTVLCCTLVLKPIYHSNSQSFFATSEIDYGYEEPTLTTGSLYISDESSAQISGTLNLDNADVSVSNSLLQVGGVRLFRLAALSFRSSTCLDFSGFLHNHQDFS